MLDKFLEFAPNPDKVAVVKKVEALLDRYAEPHRHYHTWGHILNGYAQHLRFFGEMNAPMFFAWLYHDSIYNPKAKDNEAQSANLFLYDNEVLQFPHEDVSEIMWLIHSTTHTGEHNRITDIDLVGLGFPPAAYDANTALIRQEYDFATEAEWRVGRMWFINRMLNQYRIFSDPQMIETFETQARVNLARELSKL